MLDPRALIGLRFIQGLVEGVTIPASFGILRWWVPHQERSGSELEKGFFRCDSISRIKVCEYSDPYILEILSHLFDCLSCLFQHINLVKS